MDTMMDYDHDTTTTTNNGDDQPHAAAADDDDDKKFVIDFAKITRQHGILMTIGWCFFVPCGIACSLLLRHRNQHPYYFFFRPHYILATSGIVLAMSGWIVAAHNLSGMHHFHSHGLGSIHVLLGRIVLWGALLNIMLYPATMRLPRHAGERWDEWPWIQKVGQLAHRLTGFVLMIIALLTCLTGIRIVHQYDDDDDDDATNDTMFATLFVGCVAATLAFVTVLYVDKYRYVDLSSQPLRVQPEPSSVVATSAASEKTTLIY